VIIMGTSGAVIDDAEIERGAEVIEAIILKTKNGVTDVISKSKAAWSNDKGKLQISNLEDDKRVLLENKFLVYEGDMKESNALAIEIAVGNSDVDLYKLIADAGKAAGFNDYTIRCTIEGPVKAEMAVIRALPEQKIIDINGINNVLVTDTMETDGKNSVFHFTGTRSGQISRQSDQLGEITKNRIYSPNGHEHGYSTDGKIGGHIRNIFPQKGSTVRLIIEPAKVVQILKK
ncbi:MAG: hypothetical protein WC806_04275, partial [Candidatus Gracilibacteria bacterium]